VTPLGKFELSGVLFAVKRAIYGHEMHVISPVRRERDRGSVGRHGRKKDIHRRSPPVVRGELHMRVPALIRSGPRQRLVEKRNLAPAVDRQRGICRISDGSHVRGPGRAAIRRESYVNV
jgi:hypothetical protein